MNPILRLKSSLKNFLLGFKSCAVSSLNYSSLSFCLFRRIGYLKSHMVLWFTENGVIAYAWKCGSVCQTLTRKAYEIEKTYIGGCYSGLLFYTWSCNKSISKYCCWDCYRLLLPQKINQQQARNDKLNLRVPSLLVGGLVGFVPHHKLYSTIVLLQNSS